MEIRPGSPLSGMEALLRNIGYLIHPSYADLVIEQLPALGNGTGIQVRGNSVRLRSLCYVIVPLV